jgi:hypothetical protein
MLAIGEWVVLKKYRRLLGKRGVGTGVGGFSFGGHRNEISALCSKSVLQ